MSKGPLSRVNIGLVATTLRKSRTPDVSRNTRKRKTIIIMFVVFLAVIGASAEFRGEVSCPLGTMLLTDPIGNISSPGRYPDYYSNNQQCEWSIRAPDGYTVRVTFKGIQLKESADQRNPNLVSIYDGDKSQENMLYRWTGESTQHRPARPGPIISYTNQVFITFRAYGGEDKINMEGFYLDYRILPAGTPHPGECVDYGPVPNGRTFPPHGPYRIGDTLRLECASGTQSSSVVGDVFQCEQKSGRLFPQWGLPTDELLSDVTCTARCGVLDRGMAYGALRSPGWPDPDAEEPNRDCRWTIDIDPGNGYGLRLFFNRTDFRTSDEYIEVNGRNLNCRLDQQTPYPPGNMLETDREHNLGRVDVQYSGNVIRGSSVEIFFSSEYCGDPGKIHHGLRTDSTTRTSLPELAGKVFHPGDSVTYSCEPGYEMVGQATLTCAPGTVYKYSWDGHRPYCTRSSWPDCPDPGVPAHGAQHSPDGYDVGSTVTFTCNPGYYPRGSRARTCGPRPDGISAWSGVQPTCLPTPCKSPWAPDHAHVTVMALPNLGYVAVYECDPGYVMTSGSPVRTCRPNGTWDGEKPVCEELGTTQPPTPTIPSTAGPTTTSKPPGTTASHTTTGATTPGDTTTEITTTPGDTTTEITTTTETTTLGETTEDILTLSYPSTVAITTPVSWITSTQLETTTVETTPQRTTDVVTTDSYFTTHLTTHHPSTEPLPSTTTAMTTSPPVTTSRHTTTTEMTTNPTTQRSESTTISRTTRPGASSSTFTTLPYTPTVVPTSNKTEEPPGTLGRTVNVGAAIGGSVAAAVLVAAVVGGVYFYRRKWKAESEPEWDRLHDINNDMNDMLPYQPTTQPETGHREEPFSLDGALLMEDITSLVMRDAPWGHNPALQDD